jgi:hypothetical protein
MNQSVQEVPKPIRRTTGSVFHASKSADLIRVSSVPISLDEQKDIASNLADLIKVIAILILAILCRYAVTGTLVSSTEFPLETSPDHSRFTTTPDADLMDLSTAGF